MTRSTKGKGRGPTRMSRFEWTFVRRYKPEQQVLSRVQRNGLTFELFHARLCPAQRHVIIAQYRLKGQADAKSK